MNLEVVTKAPESNAHSTPILFVHGMWHAAWCWAEHFLPYFARRGYRCYALSLRGHGSSDGHKRLRWTSLTDYVSDVRQVVRRIQPALALVGHSMGGIFVQKMLELNGAPAAVLLASAPPGGLISATVRVARRHPRAFIKANTTLSLLPLVRNPETAREALFSADMPDEEVSRYASLLRDESYRAYLDMMLQGLPRPKQVDTSVLDLGAADDSLISRGEVDATAQVYNTAAEVFRHTAHDMRLEATWQAAADRILRWLGEQSL